MPVDLRETLRDAAVAPRAALDLERLLVRGRRHRRRQRAGAVAGVFVLVGAVVSGVLAIPGPAPDPPLEAGPVRFDALPVGWTELPAPPEMLLDAATAWTGDRLLVWGGSVDTFDESGAAGAGYAFDTGTGGWAELAPSPLAPRTWPAAAWTGTELLVWGGVRERPFGDGAAYDPDTDSWRRLPPAPISARAPLSVWTGEELVVWGTAARTRGEIPTDGAAYDPATDTWRTIAPGPIELTDATAVWTGREMIVFGAALDSRNRAATETAIGAAYDPATDTWRRLPDSDLSPQASTASWNGEELIAWDYNLDTAAYDPTNDRWRSLPDVPLRSAECYPASIPVGGDVFGEYCGAMAVYERAAGRWREVSLADFAGWGRDPDARANGFALVAADPVGLLLGRVDGDAEVMLAYRPSA
jgi:hypothetical protein